MFFITLYINNDFPIDHDCKARAIRRELHDFTSKCTLSSFICWRPGKIYDDDNIGWYWYFTYFFTEIFPSLSTCMQSLVCAFCRKFVAEPLSRERLYASFISSSVQCCNETRMERVLLFCFYACTFWFRFCFVFMTLKCFIRTVKRALHFPSQWKSILRFSSTSSKKILLFSSN